MTTYIFPGQGSQTRGMGKELFAEFPEFVEKADHILGYSIAKLCLEDPNNLLNYTCYTQPALYVVNVLSYLKKLNEVAIKPNYVAGNSVGEYNALFAAGVFDFETGLELVKMRGELMSRVNGGGMTAIVGLKIEEVQSILEKNNLKDITIANYNSHTQVVISGKKELVDAAESFFLNAGATLFIPLKVSGAFHSSCLNSSQQAFEQFLKGFTFLAPKISVIANVTAKPYKLNETHSNLTLQITQPVLWVQSIEYLLARGEIHFEEIGPGRVLTGLINRILKGQ